MFIPVMELSEKPDKLLDLTDVSGLIQTQSSNGNVATRKYLICRRPVRTLNSF